MKEQKNEGEKWEGDRGEERMYSDRTEGWREQERPSCLHSA